MACNQCYFKRINKDKRTKNANTMLHIYSDSNSDINSATTTAIETVTAIVTTTVRATLAAKVALTAIEKSTLITVKLITICQQQ